MYDIDFMRDKRQIEFVNIIEPPLWGSECRHGEVYLMETRGVLAIKKYDLKHCCKYYCDKNRKNLYFLIQKAF